MTKITKHIIFPLILPALFFVVAALPVELLGCRNRGLIAALLAIASGMLGIVAAVKGLIGKVRGDAYSFLWIVSALILIIPAVFIVLIAG
jgi:hypothetical protein